MGRLRATILIVAGGAGLFCGCGRSDTPTKFYVEDRWSPEEIAVIRAAADEWNDLAMSRLKRPMRLLEYAGTVHGQFSPDVYGDVAHVVYRLGTAEEGGAYFDPDAHAGYATMQDVVIFTYNTGEASDQYGPHLYSVVLHELGHFIGLPHFDHRLGIMNSTMSTTDLLESDIEHFCAAYECK